ncbi:MAG: VOC family protein [Bacteroidota bacterium]
MHGFGHVEIPTTNVKQAKIFYNTVFGWTFTDHPEIRYTLLHTGGHPNGGLERVKKMPRKGQVNVYIEVRDIEATLKDVRKAKGKVVQKKKAVKGMGWYARFKSPDGCILCLWQQGPPAS